MHNSLALGQRPSSAGGGASNQHLWDTATGSLDTDINGRTPDTSQVDSVTWYQVNLAGTHLVGVNGSGEFYTTGSSSPTGGHCSYDVQLTSYRYTGRVYKGSASQLCGVTVRHFEGVLTDPADAGYKEMLCLIINKAGTVATLYRRNGDDTLTSLGNVSATFAHNTYHTFQIDVTPTAVDVDVDGNTFSWSGTDYASYTAVGMYLDYGNAGNSQKWDDIRTQDIP